MIELVSLNSSMGLYDIYNEDHQNLLIWNLTFPPYFLGFLKNHSKSSFLKAHNALILLCVSMVQITILQILCKFCEIQLQSKFYILVLFHSLQLRFSCFMLCDLAVQFQQISRMAEGPLAQVLWSVHIDCGFLKIGYMVCLSVSKMDQGLEITVGVS